MERYQHLSQSFKQQSVELIAGQLEEAVGTFLVTPTKKKKAARKGSPQLPAVPGFNGRADGTRTRDLRRDSSNIEPHNQPETIEEKDTWLEWAKDEEKVPA